MNARFAKCFSLLVCMFLLVVQGRGQTTTATVSGLTMDSSGAIVQSAIISLTDLSTGVVTTTKSNSNGLYRLASLLPGTYKASVTKEGFKNIVKTNIELHVQDSISLNFTLEIGSVVESVTVEATEPLLQSTSATLSQVIEGTTVQDTPLNGRNVMNLVSLTPGVVAQGTTGGNPLGNQDNGSFTNNTGWGNYQIGGGFANQSATYLDGAPINSSNENMVSLVPTQDDIQEFRVSSNSVGPEYGSFAGGVISFSSKAGANDFHGTAYEYIRNTVLDANDWFLNHEGEARENLKQNQYGVAVGGPIIKNKAFFFGSWEGYQLRSELPETLSVPTDAMRNGDLRVYGTDIYNPYTTTASASGSGYTRTQYSCNDVLNWICPAQFDSTAKILLSFYPEPNYNKTSPTLNYVVAPSTGGSANQYNARVDYNLSDKQHLFGHYTYWGGSTKPTNAFNNSTGTPGPDYATNLIILGDSYTINTSTMADLRLSYLRFKMTTIPLNNGTDLSTFGSNYASYESDLTYHQNPIPYILDFTSGGLTSQDLTMLHTADNYVLSGSVTKVISRHSLSIGGELRNMQFYYSQDNYGGGFFEFTNAFTAQNPYSATGSGLPFASFLIGTPVYGEIANVNKTDGIHSYGAFYANDTYQVSPKLTLSLGVRWEQPGSYTERHNRLTVLLPDATDSLSSSTGLTLTGQTPLINSTAWPHSTEHLLHWDLFSPRIGIVYHMTPTIVVRTGFGLSYLPNDAYENVPSSSPVNSATTSMIPSEDGNLTPYATLSNPFPNGILQPIGNDASRLSELEGGSPSGSLTSETYPYQMQWNLNLEKGFGSKTSLEIGYVGAKGNHLPILVSQLNQIPSEYLSQREALLTEVTNPFYGILPTSAGLLGEDSEIPQGYLYKPHPQFLSYAASGEQRGSSTYEALQTKFQRRFGSNGILMASYTWSKLISDTDSLSPWLESTTAGSAYGGQNAYDHRAEKSLSADDIPHNFVLSYVLGIPIGHNKRFLANVNSLTNAIIGGWSVTGITTFQSGVPLPITSSTTNYVSTYFGAGSMRPDVVPGCKKKIGGAAHSRLNEWFNTSCFEAEDAWGFGDESRNDSTLRAAGVANWDFGLYKTFPIKDQLKAQFQAQVFNLANRVQFAPPNTAYTGLASSSFGYVTAQENNPREFQFSLRFNY
jgi:hypothetical protein